MRLLLVILNSLVYSLRSYINNLSRFTYIPLVWSTRHECTFYGYLTMLQTFEKRAQKDSLNIWNIGIKSQNNLN